MREILFRGVCVANGEWVYGSYIHLNVGADFICEGRSFNHLVPIKSTVLPETVGQYTGLTDKNGKKIFEGDIVYDTIDRENALIIFDFGMYYVHNDKMHIRLGVSMSMQVEVIGNIHDNPELLKGGE